MTPAAIEAVWALLVAALAALGVASHHRPDRVPTFADILDWLTRAAPARWLTLLAWAWLGWHLLVR